MLEPTSNDHSAGGIQAAHEQRTYTICFFAVGLVVPEVQLIEASSDDEALASARSSRLFTRREVWDRHRLVAVIPPSTLS